MTRIRMGGQVVTLLGRKYLSRYDEFPDQAKLTIDLQPICLD